MAHTQHGSQATKTKKISLGDNVGDVSIKVNGVTIEVSATGVISSRSIETKIGNKMRDGTIYAGISPHTGKPMYATKADAPVTMTLEEAKEYATKLKAHGHKDWHVPTHDELNVLFNNHAAIGGFDETGSSSTGWYWSSSQDNLWGGWEQQFSYGRQQYDTKLHTLSVRCVR